MTAPSWTQDLAILLARVVAGVVFMAHGWQKLAINGVDATAAFFGQVGVPLPAVSAWFSALVELVGGAALILGAAVPLAALLLVVDMIGAYLFVHVGNGVFVDQGGFELVGALGAFALILTAVGAGRFSIDHVVLGRRRKSRPSVPTHR
jgi:putative oxidoreductase